MSSSKSLSGNKRKSNLTGKKIQIYDADAIAQDHELSKLFKRKLCGKS